MHNLQNSAVSKFLKEKSANLPVQVKWNGERIIQENLRLPFMNSRS